MWVLSTEIFFSLTFVNAVCSFLTLQMSLFFREMNPRFCHHKNACHPSQETVCRGQVKLSMQKQLQVVAGNLHTEDSQHMNLLCSLLSDFVI